jgi:adenine-specific DNA methylase
VHVPSEEDTSLIRQLEELPCVAHGFFPTDPLPDGVNLRQPKKHGIDRIDRFYTARNLSALSHLWRTIHRIKDVEIAAALAFVFTSLYQRVTRLSEFRFWGGSGNTARYNVPFIWNEANVFITFARKARNISDHLETAALTYRGSTAILQGSATNLEAIPDSSVDVIFTDPPFGGNINYSEMNFLWESWLQRYTNNKLEAIVNRAQKKDVVEYEALMTQSMAECFRVLRAGHWMLLVFMNSSARVWDALRSSIEKAGFCIVRADIFDKEHGTFKQFVSDNTAGADLVLHCRKPLNSSEQHVRPGAVDLDESVKSFLRSIDIRRYEMAFLHVGRVPETDYRRLYAEWLATRVVAGEGASDFTTFRELVDFHIAALLGTREAS